MGRVVLALVALASATSLSVQKPDFSGKWTIDTEKTATAVADPAQRYPTTAMEIKMDATTMTVVSTGPLGTRQTVYTLDGKASSNLSVAAPRAGGASPSAVSSTAAWDGPKLIVTTTLRNGNATLTYALEGANLKVEFKNPDRPAPAVGIYKKASQIARSW